MILTILFFCSIHILLLFSTLAIIYWIRRRLQVISHYKYPNTITIGFLHPFCNDCGGGEKVLWMMIKSISNFSAKYNFRLKLLIYAANNKVGVEQILKNLRERFGIEFHKKNSNLIDIELVRLYSYELLKPKNYLTMLLQILGQIIYAFEIILTSPSDLYIDSTGLPFSYSILNILGQGRVTAYVHYPFISRDMIRDIENNVAGVHSRGILSKFKLFRYFKIIYYKIILFLYQFNGKYSEFSHCNSSWTYDHIVRTWGEANKKLLYPPCATKLYAPEKMMIDRKTNSIVSFAQFRPEKNHKLQIEIFKRVKENYQIPNLHMYILGSIRGEDDQRLFDELNYIVKSYCLENDITFKKNLKTEEVKEIFSIAKIGIHTMKDEHFGISIIEMMAAGLITIAHKSAGPLKDIIGPAPNCVGFLSDGNIELKLDLDSYVEKIGENLKSYQKSSQIIDSTLKWTVKFSDEEFMRNYFQDLDDFIKNSQIK